MGAVTTRDDVLRIRLSKTERARLDAAAAVSRQPVSSFGREAMLGVADQLLTSKERT